MSAVSRDARSVLSLIRGNRRALRARSLTAADILTLESLAVLAPAGLRRVSIAALGRLTGVSRVTALRHVNRLQAAGAVVRVGAAIGLNVRGLLAWCAEAASGRLETLKRLFLKRKSESVSTRFTHRRQKGLEDGEGAVVRSPIPSDAQAQAALREAYAALGAAPPGSAAAASAEAAVMRLHEVCHGRA